MPITLDAWAEFYEQGGEPMHVILFIACVGFAVMVERSWSLLFRLDGSGSRLMAVVQCRLLAGDTAAALRCCTRRRAAVARVVHAGLMAGVDTCRAHAAIDEVRMEVEPLLRRRLPLLSTLASLAMLVGLLGTVFGLISGFSGHHGISAADRTAAIAGGLGMAIHTTGFGILVGIVLLSARLVLGHASDRIMGDVAWCAAKVVNLVTVVRQVPASLGSPYR